MFMDSRPYFSRTNSKSFLCSPIDLIYSKKRMDELARQYVTRDEPVKAELEALSLKLAGLPKR